MMGFNSFGSFQSFNGGQFGQFPHFGSSQSQSMQYGSQPNSIVAPPPPPSNPPNFGNGIEKEEATEFSFDPQGKKWNSRTVIVSCDARPFTEGSMRWCYRVVNHTDKNKVLVGKLYKTPETRETFFTEVEMQVTAGELAKKFNERGPPKKIKFVIPRVLEFKRKHNGENIMMSVEGRLEGVYKKHSNNYGWCSPDNRNTPAAFSHFTYDYTGGKMLVCDMQGVDDVYTDPQIHTPDFKFGFADIGSEGIQQFFSSHRCNHICRQLGLSQRQPKQCDNGTRLREEHSHSHSHPHSHSHECTAPTVAAAPVAKPTTAPSISITTNSGRGAYSAERLQPQVAAQNQQYYYSFQPQYSNGFSYPYGITA